MEQPYFIALADHIAQLSKKPGWLPFCRQWAKDLEDDPSGAFKGITEAVRSRLKSSTEQQKTGA
jgi:hypothetical protein